MILMSRWRIYGMHWDHDFVGYACVAVDVAGSESVIAGVIEALNPVDAIASSLLPEPFHKDPADRILVAIARRYDIPLVSCDEKILAYPHVRAVW
jgi:predicted nucleic acid-binding protein